MKYRITQGIRLSDGTPMNTNSVHEFNKLPPELLGKVQMVEESKTSSKPTKSKPTKKLKLTMEED